MPSLVDLSQLAIMLALDGPPPLSLRCVCSFLPDTDNDLRSEPIAVKGIDPALLSPILGTPEIVVPCKLRHM